MELAGKVALVTGGTRGIGAAVTLRLAQGGADVAIVARHDDAAAQQVRAEVEALGKRCLVLIGDMAVPEHATRCVQETAQAFDGLDILVHSAGGPAPGSLLAVSAEDWYHAFDVHVHGAFHLSRAAVPLMKAKGEGAIVLVSSVAGIRGCPGAIAYGVVKGAILQMTRAMARDLADDNIRVNCVAPGIIRTRFHDEMTSAQKAHNLDHRIPLHREGKPADVAEVVVMLICNEFITGESVVVDGGMSMRIA
jgi:NAD(P)-dependent dehydrogenase (short-subunit alcohol dehydrogenase family)